MRRTPLAELLQNELERQDFHPRLPGYKRVYEAIRSAIVNRRLPAGSKLPSSRDLARELSASRNMIVAAYDQLQAEGYVSSQTGSGTYVTDVLPDGLSDSYASDAANASTHSAEQQDDNICLSLRGSRLTREQGYNAYEVQPLALSGKMDLLNFPIKTWQRVQNQVWRREDVALYDYDSRGGYAPLKKAVADYLRISRGVVLEPEQVLITAGTQQSLDLISRMLADQNDVAWVENPCYWGAWSSFYANDLDIRPIAVDEEGMSPSAEDLNSPSPKFIYITPSHQYPTGAVMSLARRRQLIEYAQQSGAWLLEDDYDSEFRHSGEPIPAMLGMVPDAPVVYLGTFSKTLFPALRIGFMVMPPALADAAQDAIGALLRGGHRAEQRALASFIEKGHYARHLAAMRRLYRKRQQQLREALAQEITVPCDVLGGGGGMHLTVAMEGVNDRTLAQQARQFQLAPAALSHFYLDPQRARSGLVLGYGNTSASRYLPALRTLNRLIAQHRRA